MAYTNSALVSHTRISPNRNSPRKHAIDTITIHCVVGQVSVETLGNIFANPNRGASSNYGIGYDGRVGMYVEERDRSWCSSSPDNDHRAVTIEVASDMSEPYAVTGKAYAALISLVADICKHNGIKKLVWSTDKNTRVYHRNGANMTVHVILIINLVRARTSIIITPILPPRSTQSLVRRTHRQSLHLHPAPSSRTSSAKTAVTR